MSQYSPNGYIAAIKSRSSKSILVEGTTDRGFFQRCLHRLIPTEPKTGYVIDEAGIIKSDTIPLGNRQKVELIAKLAHSHNARLFCILDREYEGFTVAGEITDDYAKLSGPAPLSVFTWGHSIENYSFLDRAIKSSLIHLCAESLTQQQVEFTASHSTAILQACAAFCWAAKNNSVLGRCRNMLEPECWSQPVSGRIGFNLSTLEKSMLVRGISASDSAAIIADMNSTLQCVYASENQTIRLFCHGAIAFHGLWSGLAKVASSVAPAVNVQMIAGHKDEVWRVVAGEAAREFEANEPPGISELVEFCEN